MLFERLTWSTNVNCKDYKQERSKNGPLVVCVASFVVLLRQKLHALDLFSVHTSFFVFVTDVPSIVVTWRCWVNVNQHASSSSKADWAQQHFLIRLQNMSKINVTGFLLIIILTLTIILTNGRKNSSAILKKLYQGAWAVKKRFAITSNVPMFVLSVVPFSDHFNPESYCKWLSIKDRRQNQRKYGKVQLPFLQHFVRMKHYRNEIESIGEGYFTESKWLRSMEQW